VDGADKIEPPQEENSNQRKKSKHKCAHHHYPDTVVVSGAGKHIRMYKQQKEQYKYWHKNRVKNVRYKFSSKAEPCRMLVVLQRRRMGCCQCPAHKQVIFMAYCLQSKGFCKKGVVFVTSTGF
jgi:hypothetical protein